jgi:pimeloyl-ACP methyl ester carboxylesterase
MVTFLQAMKKFALLILGSVFVPAALFTGCASRQSAKTESCCDSPDTAVVSASPFTVPHTATLGTNKIHYVVAGKGSHTLVFVHCWAGNLTLWQKQIPALQDKARLVLVDLPGHGQSDKPHVEYTMDFFANAVVAVMRDAQVDRATLIGHSMGAPVICRVYAQVPERVVALVAVDGQMRRPPAMTAQQREDFVGPMHKPDYREYTTNFLSAMFATNAMAVREQVMGELMQTPQYVMAGAMDGMFGAGQPDWDLKKVNVPVISINTTSAMWDDDYKNYARSLSSHAEYRTIDGTGHWLMLEKPAEFNALLVEELQKYDLIAK